MTACWRIGFSIDRPFIVSVAELVYAGKRYRQGDAFPWQSLGVSREGIWELWKAFSVDCTGPVAEQKACNHKLFDAKAVPAMATKPVQQQQQQQRQHRR